MSTNTNKPITQSHDKLFKSLFSKKSVVAEFISKILPKNITQPIDLESLTLDTNEYIDDKLQAHCADVVYNCDYVNEKENKVIPIKISLLFEHKSYPDKYPHLQLLRYLLNIWDNQNKQKQDLTPIIPIIFYHGKQHWQYQALSEYFTQLDDNLSQFLPSFDYLLVDTSQHDNDYFKQLTGLDLQMNILLLKNIFSPNLLQLIPEIFANAEQLMQTEQGRNSFETMVLYLCSNTQLSKEELGAKMRTISPQAEENFLSTAQRLFMQGEEQGIQKGIQTGIQKGLEKGKSEIALSMLQLGSPDDFILKVTGLTSEQLQTLKDKAESR